MFPFGSVLRCIVVLYRFPDHDRSFSLQFVPSMVASADGCDDGFEGNDVHELPVKEPLYEYDPDIGEGFLVERIGNAGYDGVHQEEQYVAGEDRLEIPEKYRAQENEISDRGECWKYDLEEEHVREGYETERSFSEGLPVFPEALEGAVTPTEPLLEKRSDPFRSFRYGSGLRRVDDASSVFQKRQGKVGIFHERIARVSAYFDNLLFFPSTRCSGNHRYAVERVECATVVVLPCDVFHFLEGSKDVLDVSHSDIAADRIHSSIGKRFYEVVDRFG